VHARTRTEKFTGQAHWEVIARVKEATSLPVIGNGDVKTPEDAKRMVDETGCDGVMVGRGSFGNPWLFARANRILAGLDPGPEPTARERIVTAVTHLHDLARKKGDYAATLMRKHVAWYVRGMYDNSTLCRDVNHSKTNAEVEELLWRYLEKIERSPEPHPPAQGDPLGADEDDSMATALDGAN
jgi:tRNA-dihydrouridine synthase B